MKINSQYPFWKNHAIEAIKYIASKVDDPTIHFCYKILYFAEIHMIETSGLLFTNDKWLADKNGPTPESLSFLINRDTTSSTFYSGKEQLRFGDGGKIVWYGEIDKKQFSEASLDCLDHAINEFGAMSYEELTKKSKKGAWEIADEANRMYHEDMIRCADEFSGGYTKEECIKHFRNPFGDEF